MPDTAKGRAPVAVPEEAIRAGEATAPAKARSYAEPAVWTERMLATLAEGVRGGKWYSLMDKVHADRSLRAAFARVQANQGSSGVDHVTVEMFETGLDDNLRQLGEDRLRASTARRRSAGTISPSRGAQRSVRSGYRRCETG